jgi:hypothetical protein
MAKVNKEVDMGTLELDLGHPLIIEVSPMCFWEVVYTGPSEAQRCIGLQISYVIGAAVTTYSLNLGIGQVFYLEPLRCLCTLATVRTHYESITIEKFKKE